MGTCCRGLVLGPAPSGHCVPRPACVWVRVRLRRSSWTGGGVRAAATDSPGHLACAHFPSITPAGCPPLGTPTQSQEDQGAICVSDLEAVATPLGNLVEGFVKGEEVCLSTAHPLPCGILRALPILQRRRLRPTEEVHLEPCSCNWQGDGATWAAGFTPAPASQTSLPPCEASVHEAGP